MKHGSMRHEPYQANPLVLIHRALLLLGGRRSIKKRLASRTTQVRRRLHKKKLVTRCSCGRGCGRARVRARARVHAHACGGGRASHFTTMRSRGPWRGKPVLSEAAPGSKVGSSGGQSGSALFPTALEARTIESTSRYKIPY